MDSATIGVVFAGITGLVGALATYTATRSRRVEVDQRVLQRQVRTLQKQLVATVEHVFALEMMLAEHGISAPDRPKILEATFDADDTTPDRAPDRTGGRHAASSE